jgi:hypothetical protein
VLAQHVTLDSLSQAIPFTRPIQVQEGQMALKLEFERPGDSRMAASFTVTLVDSLGREDTLRAVADRTGEAAVVLRGAALPGKTYVAARIQTASPIALRSLRLLTEPGADHP